MEDRYCPECFTKMGKSGHMASGRKKVPRWACSKCLRTSTRPLTAEEVEQKKKTAENPSTGLHDALTKKEGK